MEETLFHPFVIPFTIGVAALFIILIYKYGSWFIALDTKDKQLIGKSIFTKASLQGIADVIKESLLHFKIFKVSPRLGYMHMSLAFGWFALIVVGKLETTAYLKDSFNLPHLHVFFRYFFPNEGDRFVHYFNYKFIMDFLLLFVLSGVLLAYFKRFSSKSLGMKKATKHTTFDRLALTSLWLIFPARLFAESVTCGIYQTGSFLTNSIGGFLDRFVPLETMEIPAWTFYSIVLGVFFVSMPFSRYMHIFTEIPHIFLKRYRVAVKERESAIDNFQIQACSRCGICIDPCQMQRDAGINNMQSVYFLRDRRANVRTDEVVNNCLMCGKCENICPVGIDLNALRQNTKVKLFEKITKSSSNRLEYIKNASKPEGKGKIGYFAGCMTLLSPVISSSMEKIFTAAKDEIWYADKNGGVCCGRPMALAGDLEGAKKMEDENTVLFRSSGITTLVTSCPICLKVFKEKYRLDGIKVIHHSEYIAALIKEGKINISKTDEIFTYHDPCELGRGCGVYDEPREVIKSVGALREVAEKREKANCCGASLANTYANSTVKYKIAESLAKQFEDTGAKTVVTACPLCKKSLKKESKIAVRDISEIIAQNINN